MLRENHISSECKFSTVEDSRGISAVVLLTVRDDNSGCILAWLPIRWLANRSSLMIAGERSLSEVHLRASRYGGQPPRGLPTGAHALVGKRERRLVDQTGIEPVTS